MFIACNFEVEVHAGRQRLGRYRFEVLEAHLMSPVTANSWRQDRILGLGIELIGKACLTAGRKAHG